MVGIGKAQQEDADSPGGPGGVWAVMEQQAPLERVLFQVRSGVAESAWMRLRLARTLLDARVREGGGGSHVSGGHLHRGVGVSVFVPCTVASVGRSEGSVLPVPRETAEPRVSAIKTRGPESCSQGSVRGLQVASVAWKTEASRFLGLGSQGLLFTSQSHLSHLHAILHRTGSCRLSLLLGGVMESVTNSSDL